MRASRSRDRRVREVEGRRVGLTEAESGRASSWEIEAVVRGGAADILSDATGTVAIREARISPVEGADSSRFTTAPMGVPGDRSHLASRADRGEESQQTDRAIHGRLLERDREWDGGDYRTLQCT